MGGGEGMCAHACTRRTRCMRHARPCRTCVLARVEDPFGCGPSAARGRDGDRHTRARTTHTLVHARARVFRTARPSPPAHLPLPRLPLPFDRRCCGRRQGANIFGQEKRAEAEGYRRGAGEEGGGCNPEISSEVATRWTPPPTHTSRPHAMGKGHTSGWGGEGWTGRARGAPLAGRACTGSSGWGACRGGATRLAALAAGRTRHAPPVPRPMQARLSATTARCLCATRARARTSCPRWGLTLKKTTKKQKNAHKWTQNCSPPLLPQSDRTRWRAAAARKLLKNALQSAHPLVEESREGMRWGAGFKTISRRARPLRWRARVYSDSEVVGMQARC